MDESSGEVMICLIRAEDRVATTVMVSFLLLCFLEGWEGGLSFWGWGGVGKVGELVSC